MKVQRQPEREWVIVADADPLMRWSLARYLGRWFEVRTSGNLAEARRALGEGRPAAVIVADEFPDGSGGAFAAEAAAAYPGLRIIRITATAEPSGAVAGVTTTVEKPFALAEVAAIIGVGPPLP